MSRLPYGNPSVVDSPRTKSRIPSSGLRSRNTSFGGRGKVDWRKKKRFPTFGLTRRYPLYGAPAGTNRAVLPP
jgi:hypothetical protein